MSFRQLATYSGALRPRNRLNHPFNSTVRHLNNIMDVELYVYDLSKVGPPQVARPLILD